MVVEYFGVKLIKKDKELRLTRDEFALINTKPSLPYFKFLAKENAYVDDKGSAYREEWCNAYREVCLKNYDLNMEFFSKLDKHDFEKAVNKFLRRNKGFKEVKDLNQLARIEGYYMMVLDEYKQVYIGKSVDLKKRIMNHWSATLSFDRTLFPMYAYDKSCFSIDFFRALDTTRIYVWVRHLKDGLENRLIKRFPTEFCTNRIGGDVSNALQAFVTMKERKL